jgi:hypothetical protein
VSGDFTRAGPSAMECIEAAMRADPSLTLERAIVTVGISQETINSARRHFTDPDDICWKCGTPYASSEDGYDACDA